MLRRADEVERRAVVIEAAFRVLARDGLMGFSMRRVADEASCTTGMIVHWFPSKAELIEAMLESTLQAGARRAERISRKTDGDLKAVLVDAVSPSEAGKDAMRARIAFWSLCATDPAVGKRYRDFLALTRQRLAWALSQSGAGEHADELADHLEALLTGMAVSAIVDPEHWTPARQEMVIDGLLASSRRAAPSA